MAQSASCTGVELISNTGRPYWFRTCDIDGDIWKGGAHIVSFPKGEDIALTARAIRAAHALLGITHNDRDTWLLDGVNDAGLTGGLLALREATSVAVADLGSEGVMGMELVTWLLASCASVDEVAERAEGIQVLDVPVGAQRPVDADMHCMFTDPSGRCVVLEAADPGRPGKLTVYRENLGLLTNSPPYPAQLRNLSWYLARSPEWNWGRETPRLLRMNGMEVMADANAPHWTMSGALPASYASYDRFVRMTMLKYLNNEGRDFSDGEMLPLGEQLMAPVIEPHNRGLYHYSRFDPETGPKGGHPSYTQYLVMYDPTERVMYLKPYGTTGWTKTALDRCDRARRENHGICRYPMAGVVEE